MLCATDHRSALPCSNPDWRPIYNDEHLQRQAAVRIPDFKFTIYNFPKFTNNNLKFETCNLQFRTRSTCTFQFTTYNDKHLNWGEFCNSDFRLWRAMCCRQPFPPQTEMRNIEANQLNVPQSQFSLDLLEMRQTDHFSCVFMKWASRVALGTFHAACWLGTASHLLAWPLIS